MISVILNVYKRQYTLEHQIQAVLNQSISTKPEDIHIWYNYSGIGQELPKNKEIKVYKCNWNTKFFGRFTIPLLCQTPYIAMFDDDILPGKDWLKNCLDTIENPETNGILGGSGIILIRKLYDPHIKVGWNGIKSDKAERVDLTGHGWFFRQEWTKFLFYDKIINWDNGEDIAFSYLAQKYGNINTFVPPHPINKINMWSSDPIFGGNVGSDSNASYIINENHNSERNELCKYYIENGWKTVNNIQ